MKAFYTPLIIIGSILMTSCSNNHNEQGNSETQQAQAVAFAFGPPGWAVGTVITVITIGGIVYNVYKYDSSRNKPPQGITGGFRSQREADKAARRAIEASDDDNQNAWYLVHIWKSDNVRFDNPEETWYKYIGKDAMSRCELDEWDENYKRIHGPQSNPRSLRFECRTTPGADGARHAKLR